MDQVALYKETTYLGITRSIVREDNGTPLQYSCLALVTNKDHSVIYEMASKYCISDSPVNYDGYAISSKGFLPTIGDIMVI